MDLATRKAASRIKLDNDVAKALELLQILRFPACCCCVGTRASERALLFLFSFSGGVLKPHPILLVGGLAKPMCDFFACSLLLLGVCWCASEWASVYLSFFFLRGCVKATPSTSCWGSGEAHAQFLCSLLSTCILLICSGAFACPSACKCLVLWELSSIVYQHFSSKFIQLNDHFSHELLLILLLIAML
jgi:hypothetical protein